MLVVLFLRGGADGLSLAPPLGDSLYQSVRPTIRVPDAAALALDGRFGLHPAAARLKGMYDTGRLVVVPAAGSPDPSRSHFDAQDFMEKGTPGVKVTATGWLGRHLTATAGADHTLRGLGIGYGAQPSLRGYPAVSTPDIQSLSLTAWGVEETTVHGALATMYGSATHPILQAQSLAALEVLDELAPIVASSAPPAGRPGTGVARALWPVAKLLTSGIPVEAACVDHGGWDTHDGMGAATNVNAPMYQQVAALDGALGAFFDALGAEAGRVTVVVLSEFGRRVAENASGGLDHGHGNAVLVAGAGLAGGVKGTWPGLASLDNGDVPVVNDYRTVLAELLTNRFGATAATLATTFPGFDSSAPTFLGVTA